MASRLHYPDRFAAAEIGAGTVSRRGATAGSRTRPARGRWYLGQHFRWGRSKKFSTWPMRGTMAKTIPGQLNRRCEPCELREKSGLPARGRDSTASFRKGAHGPMDISKDTVTVPAEVRQQLDAVLKEWGQIRAVDVARHIRFPEHTRTRTPDYWV